MRTLAILVGLGWFWLTFYGTGPLTSWTDLTVGGAALVVGCLRLRGCGAPGSGRAAARA